MSLRRQVCVAALLALSACEEGPSGEDEPSDCTWEDDLGGGAMGLSEEPLAMRVCGGGQVWVEEEGEAVATRELSVVAAPAQVLRTKDGRLVLGVTLDDPSLDLIVVPELVRGERTRNAYLGVNLDAQSWGAGPFNLLDPILTSDYMTSMTVYGSDDEPVTVDMFFANKGGGAWSMIPMVDRSASGPMRGLGRAELQFNADGELESVHDGAFEDPVSAELRWEVHLESPPGGPSGFRTTSVAADSSVEAFEQDGVAASKLSGIVLGPRGEVVGYGEDGRAQTVGWVLDGIEGWLAPVRLQG